MSKIFHPGRSALLIVAIWLVLVLLTLGSRQALVIDETRYLSVAWEMWLRGDLLVPHLNGDAYHHKPPLLFWLVNLSWYLFGVSEAAARLVPALAGLIGVLLLMPLAERLWPARPALASLAAWILFGSLFWAIWTTTFMFDVLIAVSAEIALLGLLTAWRGRMLVGWLTTGIGIGLGILAKGPVIFVYVLPAAIFAPLWMRDMRPASWRIWYFGLAGALLLGAAIGLSWALSAAAAGGEAYASQLLWGQTANRMVESFAHRRPFWWYLPLLPLLLFPWSFSAPLWHGMRGHWRKGWESGDRLTVLSTVSGLLIFSMISGKQVHYLLPLLPSLALFAARSMQEIPDDRRGRFRTATLIAAPMLLLGLLASVLPYAQSYFAEAVWIEELSPWAGLFIVAGVLFALLIWRSVHPDIWPVIATMLFVFTAYPSVVAEVAHNYQISDVAAMIRQHQRAGREVAYLGDYHGEFGFAGRLEIPVTELHQDALPRWVERHPNGVLIERTRNRPDAAETGMEYWRPYRSGFLVLRGATSHSAVASETPTEPIRSAGRLPEVLPEATMTSSQKNNK
ncbi:MAG: glycosyltransferase family 39 protein [Gammaproteobacteria bacterium]|nr:glycosyltransferase family 39 protein [Gammaproteobacteria bacterium]